MSLGGASPLPMVTLDSVSESIVDGPFGSNLKQSDYVEAGVPVLQGKNITGNRFVWKEVRFVTEEKANDLKRSSTVVGDHLLIKIGSIGYSAILDSLKGYERAIIPANLARIRPDRKLVDDRYLHRVLTSDFVVRHFRKVASKTAQPALSLKKIKAATIPLPPLAEQKRIAGILDAADALRAKRRESLAQLDTLLQSTFLDMFGDPVTNPMGWEVAPFGAIVGDSFRNGLSPSTKGTVAGEVLTLSAITGARFKFSARKTAMFDRSPSADQLVEAQTFLICRGNGNKGLVGTGAFPDRSSDSVCFPDTMIAATLDLTVVAPAYLEVVWRSAGVRRQIERKARTTNGTHKVNQRTLSSIILPVPPLGRQKKFARFTSALKSQRQAQLAHQTELDSLFASLQSRAFRGDL